MAPKNGILCGIEESNGVKQYRLLIYAYEQNNWSFSKFATDEANLINLIGKCQLDVRNVTIRLKNGKYELEGRTGSLSRFNQSTGKGEYKPVVILSEIQDLHGVVLGYKIVKNDGIVSNVRLQALLSHCSRANKAKLIPIQNAMFVPAEDGTAHIRGYVENQFIIERMNIGKRETQEAKVDTKQNKKNTSKIEQIFTPDQIKELLLGKEHGVNYKIYGNPALSAEQMKQLRKALEDKVNPSKWADPEFSADVMNTYRIQTKYGVDVSTFIHPKYSTAQIIELSTGLLDGIDISQMGDYTVSCEEMAKRRIELTADLWKEIKVSVIEQAEDFSRRMSNESRIKTANEKLEDKRKKQIAEKKAKAKAVKATKETKTTKK